MTRPNDSTPDTTTFECLECGSRTTDPAEDRVCPDCGGSLLNISVPRDF